MKYEVLVSKLVGVKYIVDARNKKEAKEQYYNGKDVEEVTIDEFVIGVKRIE